MKRDMDLVRKIVFVLEEHSLGYHAESVTIDGYTKDQICYHAYIMKQAGLIDGVDLALRTGQSPSVMPTKLTWEGHEFADAARNETNWKKATTKIAATVGTASLAVLTELLKQIAKDALGLK